MAHPPQQRPAPPAAVLYLTADPELPRLRSLLGTSGSGVEPVAVPDLPAAEAWLTLHDAAALVLVPGLDRARELALLRAGAAECLESRALAGAALAAALDRVAARATRRPRLAHQAALLEALHQPPTAAWISFDASLRIRFASDGVLPRFGYPPATLLDRVITDFAATSAVPAALDYVRRALESPGAAIAGAMTARCADGTERAFTGRLVNLLHLPGVEALVLAVDNETAADQHARQVVGSERLFREVADKAPVQIWTENPLRQLTWENRTALEFTGRTFAEEAGYGWLETVHPADRGRVEDHYRRTSLEQRGFTLEFRMRRRDGAWRHLMQVAIPRWDEQGVFVGFLGVDVDITELKEAGLRVEEAEARYRLFVEQSTDGIWRFEVREPIPLSLDEDAMIAAIFAQGWLAECNHAMARQYGVEDPADLLRIPLRDLLNPDDPRNRAMLRAFIRAGYRLADSESHERDREGHPKVFLNNLIGIIDRGHLVRAWGTQRDITLQRQLEEEARQSRKMETAGRLAGGIAHDFNNLLTAILGTSELLLSGLAPGTAEREDVEEIKRAATRAANLTRQLLAFSRRQVLQPRTLDLNQLVFGVETMLRRLIGEHITLGTTAAADLWRVRADPGQLEQVIVNLCVNARDAMPTGGSLVVETANVHFPGAAHGAEAIMPAGPYVLLTVTDTGTGMEPQTLGHIFEPFFTTKEPGRGTGLGLATVYGIVKQSGGFIFVETERGRGSRFRIYLPRVEGVVEGPEATAEPAPARATGTILLVEDEEAVRRLARRVLEEVGYRVLEAADGAEALRLADRWDDAIDLVVTDVIMPGMSGQELSARLRQQRPWLKILYVSGYTDDAILQHGTLLPNTSFLQKPFTPAGLAQRVRETLG
ncbi:MAG: response regulator [Gemmatimonadetes bacterium]|nr:response regulator [Gemmatimonadota bacterium]